MIIYTRKCLFYSYLLITYIFQSAHACGNQNEVNSIAMTQKPQSAADTKEDLEDWLDSILE